MSTPQSTSLVEADAAGRFSGLQLLVTGAGAGIGRATALRLAREGGQVIAADLDGRRLDALVADAPAQAITPVAGDITDQQHLDALVAACDGRLDGLVNNAGINDGFVPLDEVDDALWEKIIAVNLTAPFRLCRALVPLLERSAQAAIVNVGSVAGLRGSASGTAYTTAKHALVGLTRSTAFLYPKIRCNLVAPAGMITSIDVSAHSERGAARILATVSRIAPAPAQAEQIASTIAFLLSRDASNIDGAILPCDGGFNAL